MGNCEILLKEALMGAEEVGAEVAYMRMRDLDIKPCLWCQPCPAMGKTMESCIHKDDAHFFMEQFLNCDGLIISAPLYTKTPPGQLLVIRDRLLGPKVDVTLIEQWKDVADAPKVDERYFKNRSAGFLSVGGAPVPSWVTLGLPLLHTLTFSAQIAVVDQVQFMKIAEPGAAALYPDALERARTLGRRVAEAMGKSYDDVKYLGDETGICPACHNSLMVMDNDLSVLCATCGIKGTVKVDGDKLTVVFSEEEMRRSNTTIKGKRLHGDEIKEVAMEIAPRKDEIPEKIKKYATYKSPVKPPKRHAKATY
jgi:multimeric flavodoxin WrbA